MKTLGLAAAAALGVALYGASLTAAADKRTDSQLRRTFSCTTTLRALQISAFASNPSSSGNASVTITTGDPNSATDLLGLSNQQPRYGLNGACRPAKKQVALTHHGLTSAGVVHSGDIRWPAVFCGATPRVLLHFVLSFNSSGKPVSAKIAIASQSKKSKLIGFIQWSPARSVTYYKPGCTTQEQ
jgi:hypothetical protein